MLTEFILKELELFEEKEKKKTLKSTRRKPGV
jgi:hypothetical protein